jgi:hypothetical protein
MRIGFASSYNIINADNAKNFDIFYKAVGHNTGNIVFFHALRNHFEGNYIYIKWHEKPNFINKNCDVVVWPCANQLGKHTNLQAIADNIRKINCPIIAIGLGVQSKNFQEDIELTPGSLSWLEALIENGEKHKISNIFTRGSYTTQQIKKITGVNVQTGCCPSYFISEDPNLGKTIEDNWKKIDFPRHIAVCAGHEDWKNLIEIEHQLVGLIMDHLFPGLYIVQSADNMIKLSLKLFDQLDNTSLEKLRNYIVPHYSIDQFKFWVNNFVRSYYEVNSWGKDIKNMDLAIGARYHGCALAMQNGVMGCTIVIDSRTQELCQETGVPYLLASELEYPITRTNLKKLLDQFNGKTYDSLRQEKCKTYVKFCQSCGLKPKKYLFDLAGIV